MNLVALTGRMYNGVVHGWTDNDEQERSCFRGRLNFRLPNGDYDWIDAVCFKDNPHTDANGLVGWLEENYFDEEGEGPGHGRAIEVVGFLKPTVKKMTVTVPIKGGGKKDIPNVSYNTFELVIESASFVPTSQSESNNRRSGGADAIDEDFEIDEDADLDNADVDEIEEDEVPARRNRTGSSRTNDRTSRSSNSRTDRRNGGSRSDRRVSGNAGRNSGSSRRNGSGNGRKASGDDFFVED